MRIRAYVSALGVFVESISNLGMRDSFGIVQLSGKRGEKPGEKRKHGRAGVRETEPRQEWESLSSFCQPAREP